MSDVSTPNQLEDSLTPTAERAFRALSVPLRRRLAALAGAPSESAELAISVLPFGYRALLEAYGVTRTSTPTAQGAKAVEQLEEPRMRVQITDRGRIVIDTCARANIEIATADELDKRANRVRQQLAMTHSEREDAVTREQQRAVAEPAVARTRPT